MKIVGIRFKPAGKVYDFDAGDLELHSGEPVIVETEQGLGFGFVTVLPVELDDKIKKTDKNEPERIYKKVIRVADHADFEQKERNAETERIAYNFCLEYIQTLELQMNLFSVESTFDASKLTFFFTAEGRVDFRELVKILVKEFHVRIEMRQVGIRNQAKMCGGIGRCGREICCSTFMERFEPVSIKMAKEQNLSLNPTKISGLCGRLMCCLTFENETYQSLKADMPELGKIIETSSVKGKVIRHNVVCNRILVRKDDGQELEVSLDEIKAVKNEK